MYQPYYEHVRDDLRRRRAAADLRRQAAEARTGRPLEPTRARIATSPRRLRRWGRHVLDVLSRSRRAREGSRPSTALRKA